MGVINKKTPVKRVQGLLVAAHLKGASLLNYGLIGKLAKLTDGYGTSLVIYYNMGYYA